MMITDILQKGFLLIVVLLFVLSAARMILRMRNVNHAERVRVVKAAEYLNAWTLLLCFVLTLLYGVFYHMDMKKSAHAVVSLNYSEASQALNSNSTRFNMSEIICDEVVEMAIEKGALEGVTKKQLKECLTVAPCVQGAVDDETKYHISTEFEVQYHASKYTDHLDSENVIKLLTSAYKDYYIENYTDNFSLKEEKPNFEEMEYMDIVEYLNKETQSVLNYLYGMVQVNPSFVTENQSTFSSIAGRVYQFQQTQINENLRSLILQNGLAREKEAYVDRLSYHNKNVDFDRQKNQMSYELCREAIEKYSEEMTRVVLVPTWDQSGKYYMGRTKVGIDELSVMATTFSDYVASNEKEIMDNELVINKMVSTAKRVKLYESTDTLIESIYEDIKDFEQEAITAGREYSRHRMNQCIAVSVYSGSLMQEIKMLVVFAVIAYAAIMLFRISGKLPKKA